MRRPLFSREEVTRRLPERLKTLVTYLEGHIDFAQAFPPELSADNTILHRSIWREVYTRYFINLDKTLPALDGIESTDFYRDFCRVIASDEYDLVGQEHVENIANENGWVYPYGYSRMKGGQFCLTHTFKRAAQQAHGLYNYIRMGLDDPERLNADVYDQMMLLYLKASLLQSGNYVCDAIVQNASQVTAFSIGLRHSFEKTYARPMGQDDWNGIQHEFRSALRFDAALSRMQHMGHMFGFKSGGDLFRIYNDEQGIIRVRFADVRQDVVDSYVEKNQLQEYVAVMSPKPVTGCPALFSRNTSQERFLDYLTGYLLDGVALDFWPK